MKTPRPEEKAFIKRLGAALKSRREGLGLTVIEAANLLNVCEQNIYAHERGDSAPSAWNLAAYAVLYDIDLKELFSEVNDEEAHRIRADFDDFNTPKSESLLMLEEEFLSRVSHKGRR